MNFQFSDSSFECSSDRNISIRDHDSSSQPDADIFDQLSTARKKFPSRFLCVYLNINSLRYKFDHIKDLLIQNTVDLLFIAETKLDEVKLNGCKWLFIGAYKPPSMTDELFETVITLELDKISEIYEIM